MSDPSRLSQSALSNCSVERCVPSERAACRSRALLPEDSHIKSNHVEARHLLGVFDTSKAAIVSARFDCHGLKAGQTTRKPCTTMVTFLTTETIREAIANFDRALVINPGHAEAHLNRGNATF